MIDKRRSIKELMKMMTEQDLRICAWPRPPVPDFDSEGFMHPPWKKFPNIPCGSMGWRMGLGEGFFARFCDWWSNQSCHTRLALSAKYKEPASWWGFWQNLIDGG